MEQRAKQALQSTSTWTLEKMQKNKVATINCVVKVNGGLTEQSRIWLKLLEYFYFSAY